MTKNMEATETSDDETEPETVNPNFPIIPETQENDGGEESETVNPNFPIIPETQENDGGEESETSNPNFPIIPETQENEGNEEVDPPETTPGEAEITNLEKWTTPFWSIDTMYQECATFHVRQDGSITAKLLFKPTRIICVEDWSLKKVYVEGEDYTWDGNSNLLIWKAGSDIPYFGLNDLHGQDDDGNKVVPSFPEWDSLSRSTIGNALYCNAAFVYERQINVTYEYEAGSWTGHKSTYQGLKVSNTMNKIKNGEEVNLHFYGDSIFAGCDGSAYGKRDPRQPGFATLIRNYLRETYDNQKVYVVNNSMPGMGSADGLAQVAVKVVDQRRAPDMVFLSWGMNDQCVGTETAQNIQGMIDAIRAKHPDCDIVVVAPLVPNADAGFLIHQGELPAAFRQLANSNQRVVFVNVFDVQKKMMETKDYISLSGNNINHPNDFLIRIYAQQILNAIERF